MSVLTLPDGRQVCAQLVGGHFEPGRTTQGPYLYEIDPPLPGSQAEAEGLDWRTYYAITAP